MSDRNYSRENDGKYGAAFGGIRLLVSPNVILPFNLWWMAKMNEGWEAPMWCVSGRPRQRG